MKPKTCCYVILINYNNSVALVRERTIPTERPPPVGEVSPTFADRGVSRGQRNGSPRPLISFLDRSRYFFCSSSSSVDLTRLSGPRSRPTTTQKNLVAPGIEPETSVYVARNSEAVIYIYIYILYTVSTPTCFDTSASSSGYVNFVLC